MTSVEAQRLEAILRKFCRFSWEVWDGRLRYQDSRITDYIVVHNFVPAFFTKEPTGNAKPYILQSIASAMLVIFNTWKPMHKAVPQCELFRNSRESFRSLSKEEKRFLRTITGIKREHHVLFQPAQTQDKATLLASYIAGTVSFTLGWDAVVLSFGKLGEVAYQQAFGGDFTDDKRLRNVGMIILDGIGVPSKFNELTFTYMSELFNHRVSRMKINMIIDPLPTSLMHFKARQASVHRSDIALAYEDLIPAKYRIHSCIFGDSVHIPTIDSLEQENERREATLI